MPGAALSAALAITLMTAERGAILIELSLSARST